MPATSLSPGNGLLGSPTSLGKLYSSAWLLQEKETLKRVKMTVQYGTKTCVFSLCSF